MAVHGWEQRTCVREQGYPVRNDKTDGPRCMFKAGKPTPEFFEDYDVVSDELAAQFKRFTRLHSSDWYLNRALFRLWLGIAYLSEEARERSRDDAYYARASLKAIAKWRAQTKKYQVVSIEARGLTPEAPTADQSVMLLIRDADSVEDIRAMMLRLLPFYVANLEPEPGRDGRRHGVQPGRSGQACVRRPGRETRPHG
jgi:hypothetical protein